MSDIMAYKAQNYDKLIGMLGFSDTLLKNHFTLYNGYVTNTNKVADLLKAMIVEGKTGTPEFAELKRRFGWEFNGMRLHELYFGNLQKEPAADKEFAIKQQIIKDFGSFEAWEKDMKATAAMRGIGWAILYWDIAEKRLFNTWINEHDAGHLSTCAPILVIDVFEHAFMLDYGLKRADYIEALFKVINWEEAENRYKKAGGK